MKMVKGHEMKKSSIQIRVSANEKQKILKKAEKFYFCSIAEFITVLAMNKKINKTTKLNSNVRDNDTRTELIQMKIDEDIKNKLVEKSTRINLSLTEFLVVVSLSASIEID